MTKAAIRLCSENCSDRRLRDFYGEYAGSGGSTIKAGMNFSLSFLICIVFCILPERKEFGVCVQLSLTKPEIIILDEIWIWNLFIRKRSP